MRAALIGRPCSLCGGVSHDPEEKVYPGAAPGPGGGRTVCYPGLRLLCRQRGGRSGADLDDAAGQIKTVVDTAILFVCLIFVLLAPNYIWNIVGV